MTTTTSESENQPGTGASLEQRLRELRFCGDTLAAGLAAAATRCEAGHLQLFYQGLARDFGARHDALREVLGEQPDSPDLPQLADMSWLATRGVLPDEDGAITRRLR